MLNQKIRIGILGINGRMGKNLATIINKRRNIFLGAALVCNPLSPLIGKNLGDIMNIKNTRIKIVYNLVDVINNFDVLIDFTHPTTLNDYLDICEKYQKCVVIGTTGFSEKALEKIQNSSKYMKIVMSSNFSIGINIIFQLIKNITKFVNSLTDIDIIESHHRNKIDIPSGTALEIGKVISQCMNWNFKENCVYLKKGNINPRKKNTINFASIRSGSIIGEHHVIFSNPSEKIEILHKSLNRSVFSYGAIQAAKWIINQNKNGLYNMEDVLSKIEVQKI